jgi:adiponectin receptor
MDLQYWILGGVLYIGGAVIYMMRFPERFFPNKFDILGSSHQIFHLCIVVAALMHYYAAVQSFHNRQITPCTDELIRQLDPPGAPGL